MVSRKDGKRSASGAPESPAQPGIERARPGWPTLIPQRLAFMLSTARVEQLQFSRAEVRNYWTKAVRKARDAKLRGQSTDTALDCAYDAVRLACTALLAAHHTRTKGGGHHEATFAAAASLGLPGCDELEADSTAVRASRHDTDYSPDFASKADVLHATEWMHASLPLLRAALISVDAEMGPFLENPPPPSK